MMVLWMLLALAAPGSDGCGGPLVETAVQHFEDMLTGEGPASEVAFADCLRELGLLHSAQRHYLEVARTGPSSASFLSALPPAVEIGEEIGDLVSVEPYMVALRHRDLPAGSQRDAMLYVHANAQLGRKKWVRAAGSAEEVSADYPLRDLLFFELGRAMYSSGARFEALQSLRTVVDGPWAGEARLVEARILAELGRPQDALAALSLVDTEQAAGADASVRRAWLWSQLGDTERAAQAAREARHRVKQGAFLPHADLLGLNGLVQNCQVHSAVRQLERFESRWRWSRVALDGLADTGRPSGADSWAQFRGPSPADWALSEAVERALGAGHRYQSLQRSLDVIESERAMIAAIDGPAFQAIIRPHLDNVLDDGERLLHQLLGTEIQHDLRQARGRIQGAYGTAASLRGRLDRCDDTP